MHARFARWFAATLTFTSLASAEPLRVDRSAEKMRVDGALLEWRGAHFTDLGSGDDARLHFAIATADNGLYLGTEVHDDTLVPGRDVLVFSFAMPREKGWQASEVALYPGGGGQRAFATVGVDGKDRPEPSIKVVEGPLARGTGYVVEAFIPFAVIAGADRWQEGRAALRFTDVDGRDTSTLRSDDAQKPAELPQIALGVGQSDMLSAFLEHVQLLGVAPRYDFREDVSGDARPERIVIVTQYLAIFGPGYKNGESYDYHVLPFNADGGLKSAQMLDVDGDGRKELVAVGRQKNDLGQREVWLVIELDELGMHEAFGIEQKKELKGGFVDNTIGFTPGKGKPPRIEQRVGRAQGLDALTYREMPAADVQPLLLPWGDVSARAYSYDGKKLTMVEEKRRVGPAPAPVVAAVAQQPTVAPGRDALITAFKQQQNLPADVKPTRSLRANLLGSKEPEQIDVFGRVLMVSGAEIGAGTGFVSYGAPVSDARDLLDVSSADVTGDGLAELLLRIRQPMSTGVERELLVVLRADAQGRFSRILLAEVARRQGDNRIENVIDTQGGLTIEPGRARGWSAQTYTFADEATGGAQKLLLPWADKAQRYRLDGVSLIPQPQR